MVIAIEYMSDLFVGPPTLGPRQFGCNDSGGHQRKVPVQVEDPVVTVVEFRSLKDLVSPKSPRQARPSSETRILACVRLRISSLRTGWESYSFQIAMNETHAM